MYYQQNIFLFHQLHFIAVALLDYHKHYRNLHLTKGQYHITQWSRKLFHMHMTMWLLIWGGECSPSCVKHRRQKMVMKSGILLGHLLVLSWLHEAYPGTYWVPNESKLFCVGCSIITPSDILYPTSDILYPTSDIISDVVYSKSNGGGGSGGALPPQFRPWDR